MEQLKAALEAYKCYYSLFGSQNCEFSPRAADCIISENNTAGRCIHSLLNIINADLYVTCIWHQASAISFVSLNDDKPNTPSDDAVWAN